MAVIIAAYSDTHPNSRVGLMPPMVELDGGEYGMIRVTANDTQMEQWRLWRVFWNDMRKLRDELNAPLYAVQVGDGSDDNTHAKAGLISTNPADQLGIAAAVLEPVRLVADKLFIVRGTEAHVGPACWMEETLAQRVKAEKDKDAGTWSWWWLPMVVEGVRFHFAHHPPNRGWLPWTRQSAADRCAYHVRGDYTDSGDPVPDVAIFGHVHFYADSGTAVKPRTFFLPSWQLATAFMHRLGKSSTIPEIGAMWFVCDDGEYTMDYVRHRPQRKRAWIAA